MPRPLAGHGTHRSNSRFGHPVGEPRVVEHTRVSGSQDGYLGSLRFTRPFDWVMTVLTLVLLSLVPVLTLVLLNLVPVLLNLAPVLLNIDLRMDLPHASSTNVLGTLNVPSF